MKTSKFKKTSKKVDKKDFSLSFAVKAEPKDILKKISQVDLWWAKNFKGKASKINDKFSVYFGETFVDFKISKHIPGKKIVWLVTACHLHWIKEKKEWQDTEIIWSLEEKGQKTQVGFVHKGLTPESECYESCKPGWTHHIKDSLIKLIEDGKGFPE